MRPVPMPVLVLATLTLLALLATAGCNTRGDGGWVRYGFAGSSPFWEELHRYGEDPTTDQRLVTVITVFSDEKHAVHHVLERDGTGMRQEGENKVGIRRSATDVVNARLLLGALSPGGPLPPIPRLVIVRWHHDGDEWVTATFDRDDLPLKVQKLALIVTGKPIGDVSP